MKAIERRADVSWSKFVKARDVSCQLADEKCWGELEAHHLIKRVYRATRWLPENGALLCSYHHGRLHAQPLWANVWRSERLGGAAFAALLGQAMHGAKPDVAAIVEDLERKVRAA